MNRTAWARSFGHGFRRFAIKPVFAVLTRGINPRATLALEACVILILFPLAFWLAWTVLP